MEKSPHGSHIYRNENQMKVAILTNDGRDALREYDRPLFFGTAPQALLQGFAEIPEIEVHILSCTQRPMVSPEKWAPNTFFHSLHVPKIGWMRTGYQGCIRAVRRKLKEIQPDIVHGQGTERDCAISAVLSGYLNVLTIHGNMRMIAKINRARPFSFHWLAARLEEFTIPRTDGVVCITNYTRDVLSSLARKTWVVPNAVDKTFFEVERLPSPAHQILCVGTLDQRKNQNNFIRAVDLLDPKGKLELIFVGPLNESNDYSREFLSLVETRPWCRHVGTADHNVLKQYLGAASGLALPSLEDNCPMVVLEAMASGAPIAAARVGGVPELIRHEETGLLFDSSSKDAIAAAIKRLLEPGTDSLATRAKAEAYKRFHPRMIAARHVEIYREVLASRRG
jgi:glycosyltransferase involved in cell wall biosynthesis